MWGVVSGREFVKGSSLLLFLAKFTALLDNVLVGFFLVIEA